MCIMNNPDHNKQTNNFKCCKTIDTNSEIYKHHFLLELSCQTIIELNQLEEHTSCC